MTNFIFSFFRSFPSYFGLKRSHKRVFKFFEFFFPFFFFNYLLCVVLERNETIIFIFSLFQPFPNCFVLKWSRNGIFWIFWILLLFFRVGTKRNDNFYFLSFSAFSNMFWLEMKPWWYFWIFWIFLLLFWNFLLSIGYERNETIIFIFTLFQPFPTYFGLKRSHNRVF